MKKIILSLISLVLMLGLVGGVSAEIVTFEGGGSLTTTDTTGWGGFNYKMFDTTFNVDEDGIDVIFYDVNAGQITYTGDFGWPPDETDTGASVIVGFGDPNGDYVRYSFKSNMGGNKVRPAGGTGKGSWDDQNTGRWNDEGYRSWLFQGQQTGSGEVVKGCHQYNAEKWGGDTLGINNEYDTFDIRMTIIPTENPNEYEVMGYTKLHKASSTDEGCGWVWNPAMNNAQNDWVSFYDGVWTADTELDLSDVAPFVAIENWATEQPELHTFTYGDVLVEGAPNIVYVDEVGDCDGNTPCLTTIQEGIDAVASGGTVNVAAGTYTPAVCAGDPYYLIKIDKPLTLKGTQFGVDPTAAGARTDESAESIIDVTNKQSAWVIWITADSVTVDGFTLKAEINPVTAIGGSGVMASLLRIGPNRTGTESYTACEVTNNIMKADIDCTEPMIDFNNVTYSTIKNNFITKPLDTTKATGAPLVRLGWERPSHHNTVEGNIVENSRKHGICVYGSSYGPSTHNLIKNNTVRNCMGAGITLGTVAPSYLGCSNNTIEGNTCDGNNFGGIELWYVGSGNVITGNTLKNSTQNYGTPSALMGWGIDLYSSGDRSIDDVTITDNDITGNKLGIILHGECNNVAITGNDIHNNTKGVHLSDGMEESWAVLYTNPGTPNKINFNNLIGNTDYGVENQATSIVDAENNYWGCNAGPGNPGCDNVSGNIDYDPWATQGEDDDVDTTAGEETEVDTGNTNTSMTITTNQNQTNATVSVTQYEENPQSDSGLFGLTDLDIYVEIETDIPSDEIEEIEVRIYYDEADVNPPPEDTLRPYYWNSQTSNWEPIPNSGVNTDENYVWFITDHLSLYSIQGTNADLAMTATVGNVNPTIDIVTITPDDDNVTAGVQIDPNPLANKSVTITVEASDDNGFDDVASVTAAITGPHAVADSPVALAKTGNIDTTTDTYAAAFNMEYFCTTGTYTINVTATDVNGLKGSLTADFTFTSLAAMEIDAETIAFGSITPNSESEVAGDLDMTTTDHTTIKNIGNTVIDARISGTNMTGADVIEVNNTQYTFVAGDYTALTAGRLSSASADVDINLATGVNSKDDLSFKLYVPFGSLPGSYSATTTLIAITG